MSNRVRIIKELEYTDGNGEVYRIENALVIDLTGNEPLEDLLEEALIIEAENN